MVVGVLIASSVKEAVLVREGGLLPRVELTGNPFDAAEDLAESIVGEKLDLVPLFLTGENLTFFSYYEKKAPRGYEWVSLEDVQGVDTDNTYLFEVEDMPGSALVDTRQKTW